MISSPPSYTLENAWKLLLAPAAVSAGILPTNIYLSQSNATQLNPCLRITTPSYRESRSVGPGSGVFEAQSSIKYQTKLSADQQTAAAATASFEQIVQSMYWGGNPLSQTLATRLTAAYNGQFYCYAVKELDIYSAAESLDKLWTFEIRAEVWFINRSNP